MVICYLCGKEILTRKEEDIDHIPFKGLFLKSNPKGIIKLPTHKKCNNNFSSGEEFFRNILVIVTANWLLDNPGNELWEQKVKKAISYSKKKRFLVQLSQEIRPIEKIWPDLSKIDPRLKNLQSIKLPFKRIAAPLVKIAKGIYFSKNKNCLEDSFPNIKLVTGTQFSVPSLNYFTMGDGEFKYKISKTQKEIIFDFVFYKIHHFRVKAN